MWENGTPSSEKVNILLVALESHDVIDGKTQEQGSTAAQQQKEERGGRLKEELDCLKMERRCKHRKNRLFLR